MIAVVKAMQLDTLNHLARVYLALGALPCEADGIVDDMELIQTKRISLCNCSYG